MIDKLCPSLAEAVAVVRDGDTVLVGGFGVAGMPFALIDALIEHGAKELTIVSNNAGNADTGLAALLAAGQVRKVVCSFPRQNDSWVFDGLYRAGKVELELVPQGNLAERIRAAGAGIPGFYTPTGVGTVVEAGKEKKTFNGRDYLLETALTADFALIKAHKADTLGNLTYHYSSRNFNAVMATAARITIAEVDEVVPAGGLDPEQIVTPGVYVDRVVQAPRHAIRWFN